MKIENKNILITGTSGGIGNAIAQNLSFSKCRIFATYYKNESEVSKLVANSKSEIHSIYLDIAENDSIENMYQAIQEKVKTIDVIINCVGIEKPTKDPLETSAWMDSWRVNLFGIIEVCRQGLPLLSKGGVIINISSVMGKHDVAVPIELTSYAVAKSALNKFSLNLAYSYADTLRAVSISPGYTDTKMWDGFDENLKNDYLNKTPIKRFVKPDEIAKSVRSVIENDAITAQDIVVDGGLQTKLIE